MQKAIMVPKKGARAIRTEVLALFSDRTKTLEGHVNQLLQLAGWDEKRFGCAAKGEFYIAKCGDLNGEFIGLWSTAKLDDALEVWSTNQTAKAIVEAILARTNSASAVCARHPLQSFMQ